MSMKQKPRFFWLACALAFCLSGCAAPAEPAPSVSGPPASVSAPAEETEWQESSSSSQTESGSAGVSVPEEETWLDEGGSYTSKEDVALYLYQYECLPSNFMTKREAEALGWNGGSLEPYAPGMCIGGDRFGNYEGLLPQAEGRTYYECDIDTLGAEKRGAKRMVFSSDGLIYYTEDHYESFELLYGDPDA